MSGQGTPPSRFQGLSLLREEEKKKQPQAPNPQASALQAYLQRYQSDAPADGERKKRKKKKPVADGGAIKIIDADLTAAAPAARRRGPPGDSDEDRPRSRGRGAVNGADDAEDEGRCANLSSPASRKTSAAALSCEAQHTRAARYLVSLIACACLVRVHRCSCHCQRGGGEVTYEAS